MGITGLIPFLEKASSKVHLKDLRGCAVAVDTYCWLHKGVFSCAEKLARGEETDLYLQYCLRYVQLLLSYDIKPILVFDGRHLPAKALTEKRRRESREQSKKRAAELLRLGRTDEARSHMRRCVDVTHEMALRLIRECRQRNVDCIVAPYEADAQMAWLNKVQLVQYVITEDSDLTLFGAQKVIFKLDLTGAGLLVEANKLYLAMGCKEEKYTFEKFRRMCILSGCDYLDSLPGIGLAKACKFILKTEEDDMWRALKKIPQYLNMKNLEVDDEYIENFLQAEATFKHMYIYNPLQRCMQRLYELADFQTDERYCCNAGTELEDSEQAFQLALGNLNPFTLKSLDNWHPDRDYGLAQAQPKHIKRAKHKSIWQKNFQSFDNVKQKTTTQTTTGCALYFKKVDFISKTVDEEITANQTAENAKLQEADIFSMYGKEAEAPQMQLTKRRRRNSSCSSTDTPITSPVNAKVYHNPFAKTVKVADPMQKSPVVCENSSLLGVLSPKKFKEEMTRKTTRLSGLKRTIFASTDGEQNVEVEVKSRFFSTNIEKANKCAASINSNEIRAENDSERLKKEQLQALLYECDSPSPTRKPAVSKAADYVALSLTDSGIESICTEISNTVEKNDENLANNLKESSNVIDEVISLTDEDSNDNISVSMSQLTAFRAQPVRRIGLSLTKSTVGKTRKSQKKSTKSNSGNASQGQTRLSMFGFQKRPTLK